MNGKEYVLSQLATTPHVVCIGWGPVSDSLLPSPVEFVLRHLLLMRARNSSLVFALDLMHPSMAEVVQVAPVFCTPRITMQR